MGETELRETIGEGGSPAAPSAEVAPAAAAPAKTPEEIKKEEHLANLDRAIEEGTTELQRIRQETTDAKRGPAPKAGDEEIPAIDDTDPGARAWNGRIQDSVAPIAAEMEQEKKEVRNFALREFLADKPALAASPEKMKELVSYYEKIRTASERTKEGVLLDLSKAYAVVFHQEILDAARRGDIEGARLAGVAADIGVDKGATGYRADPPRPKARLSNEDRAILAKWGQTEDEWQKDNEQYGSAE